MSEIATLDPLVLDVTVLLSGLPVTRAGFGTVLVAGPNVGFSERIRFYDSASAVIADTETALTSSDPEYLAASTAFAQGVSRVAIGRAAVSVAEVLHATATTAAAGDWVLSIDGTDYTYTASGVDGVGDIVAGLATAAAGATGVTVTNPTDAEVIITSDDRGVAHTVTITPPAGGAGTVTTATANISMGDELAAIRGESADWYGLVTTSASNAANYADDIERVAAWAETVPVLYIAQTVDSDVVTSATDDIASLIKAASYNRTHIEYHSSSSEYSAAGLAAAALVADPDQSATTWAHKTLSGVATDTITSTQRTYALAKYAGVYLTLKSVGATYEGKAASGRWLDEMVAADWLTARCEEAFAQTFLDTSNAGRKVPHTAEGYEMFAADIRGVHAIGVAAGHFVDDEGDLVIDLPAATAAQKAARTYAISAGMTLAGAVHALNVNFYVAQ